MSTTRRSIEEKQDTKRSRSYRTKGNTLNKSLNNLIKQYEQKLRDLKGMREDHGKALRRKRSVQLNPGTKSDPSKKRTLSKSVLSEVTGPDLSLNPDKLCEKQRKRKILVKPFTALSSIDLPFDSFLNDTKTLENPETQLTTPPIPNKLQKNDSKESTNRLAGLSDPTFNSQKTKSNSFFLTFSDKNQQTEEPFYEILTDRERLFNTKLEELSSEYDQKKKTLELQITTLRRENEKLNSVLFTYKADKEAKVQTPRANHSNPEVCGKCRAVLSLNSDLKAKIDRLKMYLN